MYYSLAPFIRTDPDFGVVVNLSDHMRLSPSRLDPVLRDPDNPGVVTLEKLLELLQRDCRVRLWEPLDFRPERWIVGRYAAARVLGLHERTVARTLEQEDECWSLRLGRHHCYDVTSGSAWLTDTHAPVVAASHQDAASLARGLTAAQRRVAYFGGASGRRSGESPFL
jgi:hypothetical protein